MAEAGSDKYKKALLKKLRQAPLMHVFVVYAATECIAPQVEQLKQKLKQGETLAESQIQKIEGEAALREVSSSHTTATRP